MAVEEIREPDLHDGKLLSVSTALAGELKLETQHLDGYDVEVTVTGVIDLRIDNYRESNTIDEFVVYSREDCPPLLINQLCYGDSRWMSQKQDALHNGEGRLLEIRCVTGCSVAAHFTGIVQLTPKR